MQRHHTILLLGILVVGFLLRVSAVRWNWFIHGDVIGDTTAVVGFQLDHHLIAYSGPRTADPETYPLPPTSEWEPMVQHAPVWPLLGAALSTVRMGQPTVADAFLSLRLLSLLCGTLIIYLVFRIGSKLLTTDAGLIAATFTALSYVLIDYAGNGAFYTFQGLLYLLWIAIAMEMTGLRRASLLGLISGICYLVNFQAIILLPAGILLFLVQDRPWKRVIIHSVLFAALAIAVASPWLIRSQLLFGDPLYSHAWNMGYVLGKAGMQEKSLQHLTLADNVSLLVGVLQVWLPNNLYYAARKLFVIAPIAFFLFSFGLIDIAFSVGSPGTELEFAL